MQLASQTSMISNHICEPPCSWRLTAAWIQAVEGMRICSPPSCGCWLPQGLHYTGPLAFGRRRGDVGTRALAVGSFKNCHHGTEWKKHCRKIKENKERETWKQWRCFSLVSIAMFDYFWLFQSWIVPGNRVLIAKTPTIAPHWNSNSFPDGVQCSATGWFLDTWWFPQIEVPPNDPCYFRIF